jgi:splicing factor U2AF subunit
MVTEQDLATDEDYQALMQEVREECSKYGHLQQIRIPRQADDSTISLTAVGKIFLEYAHLNEALQAQGELQGRQFGSSIVEVSKRGNSNLFK